MLIAETANKHKFGTRGLANNSNGLRVFSARFMLGHMGTINTTECIFIFSQKKLYFFKISMDMQTRFHDFKTVKFNDIHR